VGEYFPIKPLSLTRHKYSRKSKVLVKAYWGSVGIAPCILDLGPRWRWVVSFTPPPRTLYLRGKSPLCPLDRRLSGPQSRSGCGGGEKNSQPLPGLEPLDHPGRSPALYHWAIPVPIKYSCSSNKLLCREYPFTYGNSKKLIALTPLLYRIETFKSESWFLNKNKTTRMCVCGGGGGNNTPSAITPLR
jgi:hypothetical protein